MKIPHGGSTTLTIRQYLSHEVADMMWASRDRGVAINFENTSISFRIWWPGGRIILQNYIWQGRRFGMDDVDPIVRPKS